MLSVATYCRAPRRVHSDTSAREFAKFLSTPKQTKMRSKLVLWGQRQGGIVLTATLLIFGYLSIWYIVLESWMWFSSLTGLLKCILYHIPIVFLFWSLFQVHRTDPGEVPTGWEPSDATEEEKERTRSRSHETGGAPIRRDYRIKWRYCVFCQRFKPPRAHHCKICRRCVLKFDHHCPFLSTCIGYHNHKFLMLFCFYFLFCGTLALATYAIWGISFFVGSPATRRQEVQLEEEVFSPSVFIIKGILLTLNLLLLVPCMISVGILFARQIWLTRRNTTSVEIWERHWAEMDCKKEGKAYNYPWDLENDWENWKTVMGKSYWMWPFPCFTVTSSSLTFSSDENHHTDTHQAGIVFPTNGKPETVALNIVQVYSDETSATTEDDDDDDCEDEEVVKEKNSLV